MKPLYLNHLTEPRSHCDRISPFTLLLHWNSYTKWTLCPSDNSTTKVTGGCWWVVIFILRSSLFFRSSFFEVIFIFEVVFFSLHIFFQTLPLLDQISFFNLPYYPFQTCTNWLPLRRRTVSEWVILWKQWPLKFSGNTFPKPTLVTSVLAGNWSCTNLVT